MSLDDLNETLDGGAPFWKFDAIGSMILGRLDNSVEVVQTSFETGEPLQRRDGSPLMASVLTITDNDGTQWRVYAKGQMLAALRDARTKFGRPGPRGPKFEVGGTIAIKYDRTEPSSKGAGFSPKKVFVAEYKPPENVPEPEQVDTDSLL